MAKFRKRSRKPKKILRIPDPEHSKHAVINSLPAKASQESYEYAIDEFICGSQEYLIPEMYVFLHMILHFP
jgi:hypothetical protein